MDGDNHSVAVETCVKDQENDVHGAKTPNPELGQLEREERKLAVELKTLCTPAGEEKRKTLKYSADILLELGKIYLKKTIIEEGIEQKMSYIRCAVLLHAAIQRFKIVKNLNKTKASKQFCQKLSDSLLKSCNSSIQTNLHAISEKVLETVNQKRAEIRKILETKLKRHVSATRLDPNELKNIENMDGITPADIERIFTPDREKVEISFAKKVQEINQNVTNFFKGLMHGIAMECLGFLPPAPCKFTIVGLGSLAREEATLYSDFEHIILLEDGIDEKQNYQSVLEYFRWFSVVFQVIVIGFGETIIPSVAVKSLNDLYSTEPGSSWFYDNYTPNGISFDGMLPHACKIPLGRQQQTKNRPHTVELIKTPQKMAEYLTQKEQIKNGYHLADVLRQSCLVYGDYEVYASFLKERDMKVANYTASNREIYSDMILQNSTPHVRYMNSQVTSELVFDTKAVFYRPFSTYLGLIAQINKMEETSTFAIIDQLYENKVLGDFTQRKLKYAFAIACEIRIKLYQIANQQRHGIQMVDIETMIGEEAARTCQNMLSYLKHMTDLLFRWGDPDAFPSMEKTFTEAGTYDVVLILADHECFEKAIELGEKLRLSAEQEKRRDDLCELVLFETYVKAGFSNRHRRLEYFEKAEALCCKLQDTDLSSPAAVDVNMHLAMAKIYDDLCLYQESIGAYENYFASYFKYAKAGYDHCSFIQACFDYTRTLDCTVSTQDADERLKTELWQKSTNVELQLLKRVRFATRSMGELGSDQKVKDEFRSVSVDFQRHIRKITCPGYFYFCIAIPQVQNWWLEDALKTLEFASSHYRNRSWRNPTREFAIEVIESLRLLCLCRSGGYKTSRQVGTNNVEQNGGLLRHLATILWRGINFSHEKVIPVFVLSWIIHMEINEKLKDVFRTHREMRNPWKESVRMVEITTRFARDCCKHTDVYGAEASPFALLLLASSL